MSQTPLIALTGELKESLIQLRIKQSVDLVGLLPPLLPWSLIMLSKLEFFILSQNSNLLIALLALVMKVAMEVLQLMPTTTYYKMLMNWRVNIPT